MERLMKTRLVSAVAAVVAAAAAIAANLATAAPTAIRWSSADTFEHTATIGPGQSAEVCGQIEPRLPVDWRFSATGPLTFNIHRHSGEEVIYAMRSYLTREQNGKFSPTFSFEWCWMWTNESAEQVTVRVDLKR
jgi:hypothetical protein